MDYRSLRKIFWRLRFAKPGLLYSAG